MPARTWFATSWAWSCSLRSGKTPTDLKERFSRARHPGLGPFYFLFLKKHPFRIHGKYSIELKKYNDMCFTCIEGIRECKHHSGPHLHNIHEEVSSASNLCAFISERMFLRVFCVYLYLHNHTHMDTLNILKGVIKFTKGSCLPALMLKSASGSKLGFIWC